MKTMMAPRPSPQPSGVGGADLKNCRGDESGGRPGLVSPSSWSWLDVLGAAGPWADAVSDGARHGAIADDIRNDRELFFVDDDEDEDGPSRNSLPPSSAARRKVMTPLSSSHPRRDGRGRHHRSTPLLRRSSGAATTSGPGDASSSLRKAHSSRQKMVELQREVDLALEFFSQETENGLDHFDGDDYLNRNAKCQRLEKVRLRDGRCVSDGGDESDDSFPGTAATSMATSVFTDDSNEFSDVHTKLLTFSEQPSPIEGAERQALRVSGTGLPLKHKTKSIISFPLSLLSSETSMNCSQDEEEETFKNVMAEELEKISIAEKQSKNHIVDFNSSASLRIHMEPFLAVARLRREEARQCVFDALEKVMLPQDHAEYPSRGALSPSELSFHKTFGEFHIGSTYGVPYPELRSETPFLYDVETFPLDSVLAETLGVDDLSRLHIDNPLIKDKERLLAPLQNQGKRSKFHQCFDSFITSQVIPLLHSQALSKGVFYTNRHQLQKGQPQRIIYRYQAFPSISIVRPGESPAGLRCDAAQGHSIGSISYHVPLTATFGTNAVYAESRPGREDWHPLQAGSPGLGFQFDGARCLHFDLRNETDATRVSLDFRIAITRAPDYGGIEYDPDDRLCCPELLKDKFSLENPGFYEEAVVLVGDVPRSFLPGPIAVKRKGRI